MNSEKRLLLAIVLSVAVIFVYQSYMRRSYKPSPLPVADSRSPKELVEKKEQTGDEQRPAERALVPAAQEQTITVENELYRAVLTNQGAGIKEFYLLRFNDKKGAPILLSQAGKNQALVLETEEATAGGEKKDWQLFKHTEDTVVYKKEDGQRAVIKSLKFHNSNYIIELELNILNKTALPQEVRYKIFGGSGTIPKKGIDSRYEGADIQMAEKTYRRRPSQKSIQQGEIFYGSADWALTKSRYFSFVLKPEQPEQAAFIESADKMSIASGVILGPLTLGPNDEVNHRFLLYAGPNSAEKIAALGPTTINVINYGVFTGIANLILKTLKLFYRIFGNYGVAIILLTTLISIILLPLTRKSLHSMKEMQKIQPEVEKIKKACGDNPQKMNKEIMALYKEHKINPLGGCLPMFLQLPVFIALYQTLSRSVELKGANFLWIKDLSEPDAAFKIPYTLPILGNYINILPILMVLAMVVQQKVSQPKGVEPTEQQRIMSGIFPIFLGVIFYNLPSGLVLYWFTNTLIMLLMQEVVLKSRQ